MLIRPQVATVAGYVAGQGTYLLYLGYLTASADMESAARLGGLMLLLSLGFQIGDLGNATVLVPQIRMRGLRVLAPLLATRAGLALMVCVLASVLLNPMMRPILGPMWFIAFACHCLICSLSPTVLYEARARYTTLACLSALQWLIPMGIHGVSSIWPFNPLAASVAALFVLLGSFLTIGLIQSRESAIALTSVVAPDHRHSGWALISVSMSELTGQLWGRAIFAAIFRLHGEAGFVAASLANGIVVGLNMISTNWLRALFTSKALRNLQETRRLEHWSRQLIAPIAGSILVTLGFLGVRALGIFEHVLAPRLLIVASDLSVLIGLTVPWIAYVHYRFQLQYLLNGRALFAIEATGLCAAVGVFFLLVQHDYRVALLLQYLTYALIFVLLGLANSRRAQT